MDLELWFHGLRGPNTHFVLFENIKSYEALSFNVWGLQKEIRITFTLIDLDGLVTKLSQDVED